MSSDLSVVAIIAAYNEADIIGHVVSDLINQGVQVYFLDDGSTDRTVAAVEPYVGRGVLAIERFTAPTIDDGPHGFEWERILLRKAQLARELDADWFIHHDADEFRESPWSGVSLTDAIRRVDTLGFNAIDFAGLDFFPVSDGLRDGNDVRETLTSYAEPAPYDRLQIRCWKKTQGLDLASSGGHEARFPGRHVFPLRFLLRHYPIRGQSHGERKVFRERQNRFSAQERARGWHVQYDDIHKGASFLRNPATLTRYDPDAVRLVLTLRHRGVEALEESLRDATEALDAHRHEIAQGREELARTHADLCARSAEVATLHGVVDARAAELAGTRAELTSARTELASTQAELASTQIELASTRADVASAQTELASTRAELASRNAELATRIGELALRTRELAAKSAEAEAVRAALEQRLGEIERWRDGVADQKRQIDALHRSLSWRWTAPARAAYRLLKGR